MLKSAPIGDGPVVYWMSRDQRINDNWALLYAQERALEIKRPLLVVFNLVPAFLGAASRQYSFMLDGLEPLVKKLADFNISFYLTVGEPKQALLKWLDKQHVSMLITDFSPLRLSRRWKSDVAGRLDIPVYEVDAHNIVPCWKASPKLEYAAYTLRPKINRLLPEFLTPFPRLKKHPHAFDHKTVKINWRNTLRNLPVDRSVEKASGLAAGEEAARDTLKKFLKTKLSEYGEYRNDPVLDVQSGLSPYIHFGHISAQRVALEVQRHDADIKSQEAFLEELIIRRELSDNFCFYNDAYDSIDGFPEWAAKSLDAHRSDPREYIYDVSEFESAQTHDPLWNAAQMEMVRTGKMHGYMRMYWAKKILQWSVSPEEALKTAIYLNDRYQLDGRDPNGYAGIAWSIGGVHDRPWFERDIFGKVRYMSANGCKRKFNTDEYIGKIKSLT